MNAVIFLIIFLVLAIPAFLILYRFPEIGFAVILLPTNFAFLNDRFSFPEFFNPKYLLLLILFLVIVARVVISKKIPKVSSHLLIFYFLFSFFMTASILWSADSIYGSEKMLVFFMVTSFCFFAPFFLFNDLLSIKRLLAILVVMGVIAATAVFMNYQFIASSEFRVPFGSNYLAVQALASFGALSILYYFLPNSRSKIKAFFYCFILAILIGLLLYAGGRAPVIFFFLTLIILFLITIKLSIVGIIINKKLFLLPGAACLIATISILLFPGIINTFLNRMVSFFVNFDSNAVVRFENAKIAMDIFHDYPLAGVGIGGFNFFAYEGSDVGRLSYPHNLFLEMMAETGIIGLILFIAFLLFVVRRFFKVLNIGAKSRKYSLFYLSLAIFAFFVYSLLTAQSSGNINHCDLFAWIGIFFVIEKLAADDCSNLVAANSYSGGNYY